nr:hypothetical protein Iba_chr07cCG9890 [Ipomoea batatas]
MVTKNRRAIESDKERLNGAALLVVPLSLARGILVTVGGPPDLPHHNLHVRVPRLLNRHHQRIVQERERVPRVHVEGEEGIGFGDLFQVLWHLVLDVVAEFGLRRRFRDLYDVDIMGRGGPDVRENKFNYPVANVLEIGHKFVSENEVSGQGDGDADGAPFEGHQNARPRRKYSDVRNPVLKQQIHRRRRHQLMRRVSAPVHAYEALHAITASQQHQHNQIAFPDPPRSHLHLRSSILQFQMDAPR